MDFLSSLFSWLNPITVAKNVASTVYQTGEAYVCDAAVERAVTECELAKKKSEWWAKYGVIVGASTVIGGMVLYDLVKNRRD
jgi:hypothetical protein